MENKIISCSLQEAGFFKKAECSHVFECLKFPSYKASQICLHVTMEMTQYALLVNEQMKILQMSTYETWGNEWDRTVVSNRRQMTQGRASSSLLENSNFCQYFVKKWSILLCSSIDSTRKTIKRSRVYALMSRERWLWFIEQLFTYKYLPAEIQMVLIIK